MKKNKKNLIISFCLTLVFIIYTLMIKYIDVKSIGPNGSKIGFSSINGLFRDLIGSNMLIYKVSEILGYVLMLFVLIYALIGLCQLIKRKSLLKVDNEIIKLGCFYVIMMAVYVLFEKVIINYRPIFIDNILEPSYPSSHTILSLCIGLSSLIVGAKYFNKKYINNISFVTISLMTLTVVLRLISGVHWFTDIVGGIIISFTLISYFQLIYFKK